MILGTMKFFRQMKVYLPLLFPVVCLLLSLGAGGFYRSTVEVHPEYISVQYRQEAPPLTAPDHEEVPRHAERLGRQLPGTLPQMLRSGRDEGNGLSWRLENAEFQRPSWQISPDLVPDTYLVNARNFTFLNFFRRALPVRAGPIFC
ncbi:MAG: hypothetical protein IJY46_04060 [Lentisphaeria bacterium]|nr:hypothetical protein [Lentisphaeria bacterium]